MPPSNEEIAETFDRVAELLEAQDANRFRVAAYRKAADTLRSLPAKASDVVETAGLAGLASLPGIGETLARAVAEILETGTLSLLERLRGEAAPDVLFATVPGIGPRLASAIHEELGIDTLEELEAAAHDGRLSSVPGFGPRRLRGIAESLAGRLGRRSRRAALPVRPLPPVESSSTSTSSTGRRRRRESCDGSPRGASIPRAGRGFRFSTRPGARRITRRSSRTRPGRTSSGGPTTGSCSTRTTGAASARRRW